MSIGLDVLWCPVPRVSSFHPMISRIAIVLVLLFTATLASARPMPVGRVRSFMYQLQSIENPKAVEALAKSDYDLLVVEPTTTLKDQESFDAKAMVAKLHAGKPGRLVLAYLDAGQAESFRTYWQKTWIAPTATKPGDPAFLLKADPDGWKDDFNVAYWDPRWQELFASGPRSQVRSAMDAGFDGVYLDWIDAYDEDSVAAQGKAAGVDPARAMLDFLLLIRKTARAINPNAIVIQQNAFYLLDEDPRLPQAIDAIGVEDTWFAGKANAAWGTKNAGDIPNRDKEESSTAARLKQYAKYIAAGIPVFTIDYCVKPENAARVYLEATSHHLVPLVTEVSLDRLTATPPPGLKP